MPTAPIRSKQRRSPTVRSPSANHNSQIARKCPPGDQRLQASASTTIASNNSPANRSMMVPIRCGERRKGIGSVLSGRMVFIKRWGPANLAARDGACTWSRSGHRRFKAVPAQSSRRAARKRAGGGRRDREKPENQLLRRPSAARFHCVTLSAIIRVDFIAAWLSWA
jgi:hypothetical protein